MQDQRKQQEVEGFMNRAAQRGSVLGLENMRGLMEELGNVQEKLPIVHVAGTNGKGSVCAMTEQILRLAGYRTGWYSSPQVFSYEEIYRVDGQAIAPRRLLELLGEVKEACLRLEERGIEPTLFEIETGAAFLYFYQENCQVVLLETGLGGRLDATNIIRKPLCSVITSVSRDHMQILGESLLEIAAEKAGIIKEGCPVVCAFQEPEVEALLEEVCRERNSVLRKADRAAAGQMQYVQPPKGGTGLADMALQFDYKSYTGLTLSLLGACQQSNGTCAVEVAELLRDKGFSISEDQLRRGLESTCWPGRFEVVCREPFTVLDGAHNADGAKKLRETLEMGFTNRAIIYIIGVLADKEYEEILELMLPLGERVFTVTPNSPRALSGEALCQAAAGLHPKVCHGGTLKEAWLRARETARVLRFAGADPMIVAFGSLSYLGDLKQLIKKNE